jgi:hypothetical protein
MRLISPAADIKNQSQKTFKTSENDRQGDVQTLVSRDEDVGLNSQFLRDNDTPQETRTKSPVVSNSQSPQHEEIPAMGRTEDSLGNGKTKHNSPEDISPKIPQEDLIVGSPVVSNSLDNCTHVAPKGEFKSNSLKFGMGIESSNSGREGVKSSISNGCPPVNPLGCGKEFTGFNDKGKKIKAFCWDKDKLGDWRCPECRARDKK